MEVAEMCNCSVDSIKNYERGELPNTYNLIQLAKCFAVGSDYLLGLDNNEDFPANLMLLDLALAAVRKNIPHEDEDYYWLNYETEGDTVKLKYQSYSVGFSNDDPPKDLRAPRIVDVMKAINSCERLYGKPLIINDEIEVLVFELMGGHAMIKADVLETMYPELFEPV